MLQTIQYCSDLHLEFSLNAQFIKKYPLEIKGDILLLAGDVVPFAEMDAHKDFFDFVADNYEHTYWVPGNHEYYHSDINKRSGRLNEQIRSNVSLVNNIAIDHGSIQLVFSTLWSNIDIAYEWEIERAMSDFHVIKNNGYRFSIPAFNQLHKDGLAFMTQAIANVVNKRKVVITHHIPTFMHYPEKYKGDVLSQAFATELSALIEGSDVHSWIYGHHHNNTPDFKIGNTNILTNQLGYVKHGEHTGFDRARVLHVV